MFMSDDHLPPGERHKSLYFMDGNVVLLAPQPDQPALLFRVHKSVLSFHSQIFSDMFDVCSQSGSTQSNEADPLYDGVPLVHMPDNANHLESVLGILYYQSALPWMPHSPHYPTLVTPILELSRKYGINRTNEQVMVHLMHDWPQTLKEWDRLESDIKIMAETLDGQCIDDHFPEPASAIRLARQFDMPSILPAAFYHLSRLSVRDDWEKMYADPALRTQDPRKRTAQWSLLSAKDFRSLLLGKAEIADMVQGGIKPEDLYHTSRGSECRGTDVMWRSIRDRYLQSADPLAALKSSIETKFKGCPSCIQVLETRVETLRSQIWEKLEDLFHLKDG